MCSGQKNLTSSFSGLVYGDNIPIVKYNDVFQNPTVCEGIVLTAILLENKQQSIVRLSCKFRIKTI